MSDSINGAVNGNPVEASSPEQLTPAERFQQRAEAEAEAAPEVTEAEDTPEKAPKKVKAPKKEAVSLDIGNAELFPSLGGGAAKTAAPVSWGAGSGPSAPAATASNAPHWTPKIAVSSRPQQTRLELTKEQKAMDLRKPHAEIIKDIQRKTGTKIDVASREGTSIYIIVGSDEARETARKEINKEIGVKVR